MKSVEDRSSRRDYDQQRQRPSKRNMATITTGHGDADDTNLELVSSAEVDAKLSQYEVFFQI